MDTLAQLGRDRTRVRKGAVRPEITPEQIRGLLGDVATGVGVPFIDAARQAAQGNYGQAAISGLLDAPPIKLAGMALGPLVTAFHGTPHKFTKFDISKVGTGEGAQAFGHGMYFAENPKVAEAYQNAGIGGIDWEKAKYKNQKIQSLYDNALKKQDIAHKANNKELIDKANAELYYWESLLTGTHPHIAKSNALDPDTGWPELANFVKNIDEKKFKNINFPDTSLYKVYIPDEAVGKMLNWDKPFAQQPKEVQSALMSLWEKTGGSANRDLPPFAPFKEAPGQSLHGAVGMTFAPAGANNAAIQKAAAEALNTAGIPGISYLDAGSRGMGDGTRNFVIFDPQIVKILERNNQPITGLLE